MMLANGCQQNGVTHLQSGKNDGDSTQAEHPMTQLKQLAKSWSVDLTDEKFAQLMDKADKLAILRNNFHYMKVKQLPNVDLSLVSGEEDCVYFCGNSLGLQPIGVADKVNRELTKWANEGVHGHLRGAMPWAHCDEVVDAGMARLVGAKRSEVAVMNGLTVNEHLLLISFYRPTPKRHKILLEDHAFPSDHYCVESQIRMRGYDPKQSMLLIKPRQGEDNLRTEDILAVLEEHGDEIAVVLLSGVQYYTGQLFQMHTITQAAQAQGCYVGWDLAHAAGNVPLSLHDWGADFACWCSYKYMNSGAGCLSGFFIHEKHFGNKFDKLHGWWSHRMSSRFLMNNELDVDDGARGYRISNPPMLLCASIEASLDVFNQTSMEELREKSVLLTAYLEYLILHYYPNDGSGRPFVKIITPSDPAQRGAQLSIMFSVPIGQVYQQLIKRGCVLDKREPNVIRVAPAPLYNSFSDVHRFIRHLGEALHATHGQ